jgi:CBS domain-containing protein
VVRHQEDTMKVQSLMHTDAITCRIDDSAQRAAQLMWDHDLGCVPVVDEQRVIAGIVTDRDLCMAAYTRGELLADIPVTLAMTRDVRCCGADDDLHDVERIMSDRQIRRMPVVDSDGHPIAVISINDIARASMTDGINPREVAATVAAVSTPRERSLSSVA